MSYINYAAIRLDGCSQSYVVLSPFRIAGGGKTELLASDIERKTVGRGTEYTGSHDICQLNDNGLAVDTELSFSYNFIFNKIRWKTLNLAGLYVVKRGVMILKMTSKNVTP